MSTKTISWTCVADPDWEWRSGSPGNPGLPVANSAKREGTIMLPPNEDYWYPCIELVLQGQTIGNTYLRYFQEQGVDKIQAIIVAQNTWEVKGDVGIASSNAVNEQGGISLYAEFVNPLNK